MEMHFDSPGTIDLLMSKYFEIQSLNKGRWGRGGNVSCRILSAYLWCLSFLKISKNFHRTCLSKMSLQGAIQLPQLSLAGYAESSIPGELRLGLIVLCTNRLWSGMNLFHVITRIIVTWRQALMLTQPAKELPQMKFKIHQRPVNYF